MITLSLLVVLLGQTPTATPQDRARVPAGSLQLRSATHTANGDRTGLTVDLEGGRAATWFLYYAASACEPRIAQAVPPNAFVAWQVDVAATPARGEFWTFKRGTVDQGVPSQVYRGVLPGKDRRLFQPLGAPATLQITWQRRWEDGVRKDGAARTVQLSIRPGASVMLDFLSATPTDACNAVGVSLEIGSAPARSTTTIESDLWLIHRRPDGTEQTQRQTLRSRLSSTGADYYFDDIKVATPRGDVVVEILGRVSPFSKQPDAEGGKLQMNVEIERRYSTLSGQIGWKTKSGGTTYSLNATPGEVLSFNLPPLDDDGVLVGHRFSLRLQPTQLKSPASQ